MAQKYVIIGRKSPKDKETVRYYAVARATRVVDVDTMCERISERSTYSKGELNGVIGEFLTEIGHVMRDGNIAQLGALGNFRLTMRTKDAPEDKKHFTRANIRDARVRFYPGSALRKLGKTMEFKIWSNEAADSTDPKPQEGSGKGHVETPTGDKAEKPGA